jgi:tripartite-type tricarboxylate transporter receptor subunit TctC
MKKLFALLLAMAMIISMFAACGAKAPAAPAPAETKPAAADPAPTTEPAPVEVKWPNTAVQLVCAYAAGGGTDICCRTMAEALSEYGNFGVVNNTDGGGIIGWEQVRTSDADECNQLIFALNSMFLSYLSGVSDIHPLEDIQPVFAMDTATAYFVVVNKNAPYNSIEEMIEYSKANGPLTLGAGTPGTSMTIITSQFVANTGMNCRMVATDGGDANGVAMVMGGNLDLFLTNQNTTVTYLEANEIKVLAAVLPVSDIAPECVRDIPDMDELGYGNCKMPTTFVVWAPKGADRAVYEKINELFNEAYNKPETKEAFLNRGDSHVLYGNLDETEAKLRDAYNACEVSWNEYMASQG